MTTRKHFLVASGAVAATSLAAVGAIEVHQAMNSHFVFNSQLFARTLARSARHRQCFATTHLNNGEALILMLNSLNAYEYDLGEGPGTLHCAAVFYHGYAAAIAFNDQVWNELVLPSNILSAAHSVAAPAGSGNPYLSAHTNRKEDASVEALSARGASFFVCHNSIQSASTQLAQALSLKPADVMRRLLAGIVPQAQVVPAGVMAVNALQEAHFTYING